MKRPFKAGSDIRKYRLMIKTSKWRQETVSISIVCINPGPRHAKLLWDIHIKFASAKSLKRWQDIYAHGPDISPLLKPALHLSVLFSFATIRILLISWEASSGDRTWVKQDQFFAHLISEENMIESLWETIWRIHLIG